MPKLVIFRGQDVAMERRLEGRTVRIGRDARNEIVLDDKSVSRFHAEVRAEGNTYFIVDTKSRNGVWVNGQQAKGKTALALGAPVTLGAYELTLEDDVPTGEFDEESPLLAPRTVVNAPATATVTDQTDRSRSATRASMKAPTATKDRQVLVWSGVAAAVLLISGITFAIVKYRSQPAPIAEVATPLPDPPTPIVPPAAPEPPPPDPTKVTIDKHLEDGQAALGKGDYASARDHVTRILELDPANSAALELKRRIDAGARGVKPPTVAVATPTPPPPVEVETAGIPRRPGEAWSDYLSRVQRIDVNFKAGKGYIDRVDKPDFANALARFRLVERDQKGYQGVEALIADAVTRQRAALAEAMKNGEDHEKLSRWKDARGWYVRALEIDPGSTTARDKQLSAFNRLNADATKIFDTASTTRKLGNKEGARKQFQSIVDLMYPGDEIRSRAEKELEALKP